MRKKYYPRAGSRISDTEAKAIGKRLDDISKANGGNLTPRIIVEDARKKTSPLHKHFEWDNDAAAENYRLSQARDILRNIKVVYEDLGGRGKHVDVGRAWLNLVPEEIDDAPAPRVYLPTLTVMRDPTMRQRMLHRALEEVRMWEMRYRKYHELSQIFKAIEGTRKTIRKKTG